MIVEDASSMFETLTARQGGTDEELHHVSARSLVACGSWILTSQDQPRIATIGPIDTEQVAEDVAVPLPVAR